MSQHRLAQAPPAGVPRRTALVTGSSSGIGLAIAYRLASQGFNIGLTRMPSEPPTTSTDLATKLQDAYGVEAAVFEADLSDPGVAAPRLFNQFIERFTRIDVLVNNAGYNNFVYNNFEGEAPELVGHIRAHFAVNYESPFVLSWLATKQMANQPIPDPSTVQEDYLHPELERNFYTAQWGKGRIINTTSVHAQTPLPDATIYVSTKHALRGLTVQMAADFATSGITVNAVGPGLTATPMTNMHPDEVELPHLERPGVPLGRPGRPSEVAGAVGYLSSLSARYVTGQSIYVEGGFLLANPQYPERIE